MPKCFEIYVVAFDDDKNIISNKKQSMNKNYVPPKNLFNKIFVDKIIISGYKNYWRIGTVVKDLFNLLLLHSINLNFIKTKSTFIKLKFSNFDPLIGKSNVFNQTITDHIINKPEPKLISKTLLKTAESIDKASLLPNSKNSSSPLSYVQEENKRETEKNTSKKQLPKSSVNTIQTNNIDISKSNTSNTSSTNSLKRKFNHDNRLLSNQKHNNDPSPNFENDRENNMNLTQKKFFDLKQYGTQQVESKRGISESLLRIFGMRYENTNSIL
jgi:hypothetical protein